MSNFFISELNIYGQKKETISIKFKENLNLIIGKSNIGKTLILDCIDYVLGKKIDSSETILDENWGYDSIEATLKTSEGKIRIKRNIISRKNKVTISSEVSTIKSGEYNVKRDKNPQKQSLPQVLLSLYDINKDQKAVKQEDYKCSYIGLRTISPLLYLAEDDVVNKKSILLPLQPQAKTLYLSALLLFLFDIDLSKKEEKETEKEKKEKRKAVLQFVIKKINKTEERINDIKATLNDYQDVNQSLDFDSLSSKLTEYENEINEKINIGNEIYKYILELEQELSENQFSLNQLKDLKNQYQADINRLELIQKGEEKLSIFQKNTTCPYCDNKLQPRKKQSYIKAAKAELEKINSTLSELNKTEILLKKDIADIQAKITEKTKEKNALDVVVNSQLIPKTNEIKKDLDHFKLITELQTQQRLLEEITSEWRIDAVNYDSENLDNEKYKPKDYFTNDFFNSINNIYFEILKYCKFKNLNSVKFDFDSFDFYINETPKSKYGKGYRAFLNTVAEVSFRIYFSKFAKHDPGFLLIDTPDLGLDEEEREDTQNMLSLLYEYLSTQNIGQLIFVENTNVINYFDSSNESINTIFYGPGKGFLEID